MQGIPDEFWWIGLCLNAIIIPAGSALGAWLLYKFWPSWVEGRKQEQVRREKIDNAALEIARETINWSRQELTEQQLEFKGLREAIGQLVRVEEQRAKLFTLQNGILSDIGHTLAAQQAKLTMLIDILNGDIEHDNGRLVKSGDDK